MIEMRLALASEVQTLREMDIATRPQFVERGYPEANEAGSIPDAVAAKAIEEGRLLIARLSDTKVLVGWMYLTRSDGELCLGQIIVDPSRQQEGIGSLMMAWLISHSVAAGESSIVLSTQRDLPWNRPWYEALGFLVIAETDWSEHMSLVQRQHVAEGIDWGRRVHMRLRLDADSAGEGAGSPN